VSSSDAGVCGTNFQIVLNSLVAYHVPVTAYHPQLTATELWSTSETGELNPTKISAGNSV
jgi:hypothetical protein